MYTSIDDLKNLQTVTSFNVLEQLKEDFLLEKRNLNIRLLEYLQYDYSSNLKIESDLNSYYFEVIVYCSYWSDYRQDKLDTLEDALKECCHRVEVIPQFVTADEKYKQVFKVIFNHS